MALCAFDNQNTSTVFTYLAISHNKLLEYIWYTHARNKGKRLPSSRATTGWLSWEIVYTTMWHSNSILIHREKQTLLYHSVKNGPKDETTFYSCSSFTFVTHSKVVHTSVRHVHIWGTRTSYSQSELPILPEQRGWFQIVPTAQYRHKRTPDNESICLNKPATDKINTTHASTVLTCSPTRDK